MVKPKSFQTTSPELDKSEEKVKYTMFFLSFDLVNSTEFKVRNPDIWLRALENFYNEVRTQCLELNFSEWKKAGDEVLFYFQTESTSVLISKISGILNILKTARNSIREGILDIKSTLWSAVITDTDKPNMFFPDGDRYDFVGPDIDFGFRISGKSAPGVLCIDPKIVWLLLSSDVDCSIYFFLVSYTELKGVWKSRRVPIIWCPCSYTSSSEKHWPRRILPYDEHFRNETARECINKQNWESNDDVGEILNTINEELKSQWSDLKDNLTNKFPVNNSRIELNRVELHVVLVCLFNNKVLCAKRPDNKRIFGGLWELGCAHPRTGDVDLAEQARQDYLKTFNIDVDIVRDNDNFPIPVASYGFSDSDRYVPGIVFVARSKTDQVMDKKSKYSETKYFTIDEIRSISKESAVPGFHNRIDAAFALINKFAK